MKAVVERDELEPGCADDALGVASRLAATERLRPEERVGSALESMEEDVPRPDVLPEAELSAGSKDTPQLLKRCGRVGNAAEDPHQDRGIERSVLRGKHLREALDDLDRHARTSGPFFRFSACGRVGLDGEDAVHGRRIELERAPVTRADLDHPAAQPSEQPPPQLAGDEVGSALLAALEIPREARLLRSVER